jgi:RHS repeat-associated protein
MFTTYERDSESGNDYALARYYASRLGRFISPDALAGSTSDPQSLNRYTYAHDLPTNLVDLSGMCPDEEIARRRHKRAESRVGGRDLLDDEEDFLFGQDVAGNIGNVGCGLFDEGGGESPALPLSAGLDYQGEFNGTSMGCTISLCVDPVPIQVTSLPAYPDDSGTSVSNPAVQLSSGSEGLTLPWETGANLGALQYQQYQGTRLLKTFKPSTCGGGYFVGRGFEFDTGVVHAGGYVMVTYDSRSGTSVGYLSEAGAGPLSGGHESSVNPSSGHVDSSNLVLIGAGDHFGAFEGASSDSIQLGAFGSAFGRIGGGFINLVFGDGCRP